MYLLRKMRKRLTYFNLILAVLAVSISISISAASAAESNGVSNIIDQIVQEYPDGSYFSVDGKSCATHINDQSIGCDNCELLRIHPELTGKVGDAWTCVAFARYVFYEVFGLNAGQYSSNCQEITLSNAKNGDLVVFPGHQAIYLYSSGDNYYLYESNYSVPNYVKYGHAYTSTEMATATIWHANNYDTIAGTPTIEVSKKYIQVGENVTFNFSPTNANSYSITICKDGGTPTTSDCGTSTSYTTSFTDPGIYSAYVTAHNDNGSVNSDPVPFTVLQPDPDYIYTVTDGEATITRYARNLWGDIVIPDMIDDFPVTGVGDGAYNSQYITSLTIPKGVKSIGDMPCEACLWLEKIIVDPDNEQYKSIDGVLYNKAGTILIQFPEALSTYRIPQGVTEIGRGAFYCAINLKSVSMPDSVTSMGDNAFGCCYELADINLSAELTSIGAAAFADCNSLTYISVPGKVTNIGGSAFYHCSALSRISLNSSLKCIKEGAFMQCPLTEVILPEGLLTIGDGAFSGTGINSIVIPESVEYIGDNAFSNGSLKTIVFLSPNTEMYKNDTIPTQTTIIGYADSTAYDYATSSSPPRKFIDITPGLSPVTVTTVSPSIEVSTTPLEVIVQSDVENGTLKTSPENGVVTMPQTRIVSSTSLGDTVDVNISNGTDITGPSNWDGTINLPQVASSNSITAIMNHPVVASIGVTFEIGTGDTALTFSQPVRIFISGQGGQKTGWVRDSVFTPIVNVMSSDSAESLGLNEDGYLTVGNDLVIWTKHFTTFAAYTETALTGYTLCGQVLVEGDDLTEGQTHYSGGVTIELKQGEEIKYSTTSSEAADLTSNGGFSLTGIAAGEYMVVISKAGYLTRSFALTINSDLTLSTTSNQYLNRIYLLAGDIVSDEYHVIAASDVNYILSQFNSNSTQAGFDPQVDIVKDQYNVISAADVNLMLSNFNKNSTQYPADIVY